MTNGVKHFRIYLCRCGGYCVRPLSGYVEPCERCDHDIWGEPFEIGPMSLVLEKVCGKDGEKLNEQRRRTMASEAACEGIPVESLEIGVVADLIEANRMALWTIFQVTSQNGGAVPPFLIPATLMLEATLRLTEKPPEPHYAKCMKRVKEMRDAVKANVEQQQTNGECPTCHGEGGSSCPECGSEAAKERP